MTILPNKRLLRIKQKKWAKRNSIKQNYRYITKILDMYHLKYKFIQGKYNEYDILIIYILNRYKVEVDCENMTYKLLIESNLMNNPTHKHRFKLIETFQGEELIFDVIKYIKNKNINKLQNNVEKTEKRIM